MFGIGRPGSMGEAGRTPFTPKKLFRNTETGFWYDPSDIGTTFGAELVTNGTFDSDITGWTNVSDAGGSIAWSSDGTIELTNTTGNSRARQFITTEVGKQYEAIFYNTGAVNLSYEADTEIGTIFPGTFAKVLFTATSTSSDIQVKNFGAGTTGYADNISVREVISTNTKLFQDSAGTTPVTGVEQPVGLMLDKSAGASLGAELYSFANTYDVAVGTVLAETVTGYDFDGTGEAVGDAGQRSGWNITTTAGSLYRVSFTLVGNWANSGDGFFIRDGSNGTGTILYTQNNPSDTTYTVYFVAASTTSTVLVDSNVDNSVYSVSNISVKEVAGQHATQATSASRPTLSARYNLLEQTEAFDDAYWTRLNSTILANNTTDPLAGASADLLYPSTSGNSRWVFKDITSVTSQNKTYTVSVYAKAQNKNWLWVGTENGTGAGAVWFDLSSGSVGTQVAGYTGSISDVGNGWYKCTVEHLFAGLTRYAIFAVGDADNSIAVTANSTDGIYIWGASLVESQYASLGYQRVGDASTTASDYDSSNSFPKYLKFDGTDDYMVVNGLSAASGPITAHFGYVTDDGESAGVNQTLLDIQTGRTVIFGANTGGSFLLNDNTNNLLGIMDTEALSVITALDSTGDSAVRLNGSEIGTSAAFTDRAISGSVTLGSRNLGLGAANYLDGNLYSAILRNTTSTDVEIDKAEAFINRKMGGVF